MAFRSPLPRTVVTISFGNLLSSSRKISPSRSAFSDNFSSSKTFNRQQQEQELHGEKEGDKKISPRAKSIAWEP